MHARHLPSNLVPFALALAVQRKKSKSAQMNRYYVYTIIIYNTLYSFQELICLHFIYCWLVVLQAWDLRSQWKSLRMRAAACLGPTEGLEGVRVPDTNTKNQALCTDTHRLDFPFVFFW